jgi:ribose transport system permease protein
MISSGATFMGRRRRREVGDGVQKIGRNDSGAAPLPDSATGNLEPGERDAGARRVDQQSRGLKVGLFALRNGMLLVLVGLVITARVLYPRFLTLANIRDMLSQNAAAGIIAVGMTIVIIGGGFDLSVGAVYGIGAVVFANISNHVPFALDLLIVVVVGALAGLGNGLIVTQLRVNAFIATLGTSYVYLGFASLYSNNQSVEVSTKYIYGTLGGSSFLGLPISGEVMVGVFVLGGILLHTTTFGQGVRAVGGSKEAARLAGLRVKLITTLSFIVIGALAAFAGSVDTSLLGSGQAIQGSTLPLLTIAVVILGGTSLAGGEGAIWRTFVGLMILATMNNLFDSLALNSSIQLVAEGGILIAAVSLDLIARAASTKQRQVRTL